MSIEKFMSNLRKAIRNELNRRNCSLSDFAFSCDISCECLCGIMRKKTLNPKISTIISICENSEIDYSEIFEIQNIELFEEVLKSFYITNGKTKYELAKF